MLRYANFSRKGAESQRLRYAKFAKILLANFNVVNFVSSNPRSLSHADKNSVHFV